MSLRTYPLRFLLATALSSLLLLGLACSVAWLAYRQQSETAEELGENIGSRRAAGNLEETLADLAALHRSGQVDVTALHERIAGHLAEIRTFANKEEESLLADQVERAYAVYLGQW